MDGEKQTVEYVSAVRVTVNAQGRWGGGGGCVKGLPEGEGGRFKLTRHINIAFPKAGCHIEHD